MTVGADSEEFSRRHSVSRETIDRLTIYESIIQKWSPVINIIARSTFSSIWQRHFLDSADSFTAAGIKSGRWLDLGSGGGFPGLVIAILAAEIAPDVKVTCVESDLRKCEFMRTVSRATGVSVGILSRRIEEIPPQNASVISARALAPLNKLLALIAPQLSKNGVAVLHKGENWQVEVDKALETWRFAVETWRNPRNPNSVILKIGDISRG